VTSPFSKKDFTKRLHGATESLLNLVVKESDKDEATRLFDKRCAVEECLAWWFKFSVDLDDDIAYHLLEDLRIWIIGGTRSAGVSSGKTEGYKLVLSYIDEY